MSDYLGDKYKPEAICPRCGTWNWKPIMYNMKKEVDAGGQTRYSIISNADYTCKSCGCKWTETSSKECEVSLDVLMSYKEESNGSSLCTCNWCRNRC